jgi:hypothetical protein
MRLAAMARVAVRTGVLLETQEIIVVGEAGKTIATIPVVPLLYIKGDN